MRALMKRYGTNDPHEATKRLFEDVAAATTRARQRIENNELPFIGWKACDEAFYFEGCRITDADAIHHWKRGTARFLPKAAERVKKLLENS
jgi:hypothetical protein